MSKKEKHSMKALTNLLAGLLAPLFGRGTGRLLLTALLLLAGQCYAFAQSNTYSNPYVNSYHQYEVATGGGDQYEWNMYPTLSDAQNGTNVTQALQARIAISDNPESIVVYFDASVYDEGEDYYLVYSEYSIDNCIARRVTRIDVVENNLTITAESNSTICNDYTGSNGVVWDNSTDPISDETGTTNLTFTITLDDAGSGLDIDSWTVSGTISKNTTDWTFNAFPVSGTSSNGTCDISGDETGFTIIVSGLAGTISTDEVTFTISLNGLITSDVTVEMNLNGGGYASYGNQDPGVFESPTLPASNKTTTKIVFGVPNTSLITSSP